MKIIGLIVIGLAIIVGLGLLLAFPTMWIVNYLFSQSFLLSVFGVSSLNIWQAWALNAFLGSLRGINYNTKD